VWHKELWLIDHGASFISPSWTNWEEHAKSPFKLIKDHVLLPQASMIKEADELFKSILTPATLQAIAITDSARVATVGRYRRVSEAIREVYYQFLVID
jgi:uncharacterized UPF0146 family protein